MRVPATFSRPTGVFMSPKLWSSFHGSSSIMSRVDRIPRIFLIVFAAVCCFFLLSSLVSSRSSIKCDSSASAVGTLAADGASLEAVRRPREAMEYQELEAEVRSLKEELETLRAASPLTLPPPSPPPPPPSLPLPSLTIFTAPFPYTKSGPDPQLTALKSWLSLRLKPSVVLLGNHPSFKRIAEKFSGVTVQPNVDFNFRGVPLVSSIFAVAQVAKTDLSMIISPDVVLGDEAFSLLISKIYAAKQFKHFFLVSAVLEVPELPDALKAMKSNDGVGSVVDTQSKPESLLPEQSESQGGSDKQAQEQPFIGGNMPSNRMPEGFGGNAARRLLADAEESSVNELQQSAKESSMEGQATENNEKLSTEEVATEGAENSGKGSVRSVEEGLTEEETLALEMRVAVMEKGSLQKDAELFVWNHLDVPLHGAVTPPFSYGRGAYASWLVNEVTVAGLREVLDITEVAIPMREEQRGEEISRKGKDGIKFSQKRVWNTPRVSRWETVVNRHLALWRGNYSDQKGSLTWTSWRVMSCNEADASNMCIVKRRRPGVCSCEYSAYVNKSELDPVGVHGKLLCGSSPKEDRGNDVFSGRTDVLEEGDSASNLIHTPERLLPYVADENKVVILVAVSQKYFAMLMSFICRLRELGLPMPLIAAMDDGLYNLAYQHGLSVYYEQAGNIMSQIKNASNCGFATECFAKITKVKSRAVLRILKMGYTVLWSDVDIWWFKDPRPGFEAFGPGVFPLQSNEYNMSYAANVPRQGGGINSGLYYARSEMQVIEAFGKIVTRAAASPSWISEQPSFYDELCGEKGEFRKGDDECAYPNGLKVVLLDRRVHPNGLYNFTWFEVNVTKSCLDMGCETLHNNYRSGIVEKAERFKQHNLWRYDEETELCHYDWNAKTRASSGK